MPKAIQHPNNPNPIFTPSKIGEEYTHQPAGENGNTHRENHIACSAQGIFLNVIKASKNFHENIKKQNGMSDRKDRRIVCKDPQQHGTKAGKERG